MNVLPAPSIQIKLVKKDMNTSTIKYVTKELNKKSRISLEQLNNDNSKKGSLRITKEKKPQISDRRVYIFDPYSNISEK